MKSDKTKQSKLNIVAGIAFVVLCILALWHFRGSNTAIWLIKVIIGLLVLGCILISIAALLMLAMRCLFNGMRHILYGKQDSQKGQPEAIADIIKDKSVMLVIVLGIISIFLVLPFLAAPTSGESETENERLTEELGDQQDEHNKITEDEGLVRTWIGGIEEINELFDFDGKTSDTAGRDTDSNDLKEDKSQPWVTYALIYIILLGVGAAAAEILYSVIERIINKKPRKNLIDEYSSPIALLAVGVALLIMLQDGGFSGTEPFEKIGKLMESYGAVILTAAITILTLEIIRLLMDIRNTYIRQEARYIFIALIGQVSLLLIGILNSVSSALNSAIGIGVDAWEYPVYEKLRRKVIDLMDANLDADIGESESLLSDFQTEDEDEFRPFDEVVTKK